MFSQKLVLFVVFNNKSIKYSNDWKVFDICFIAFNAMVLKNQLTTNLWKNWISCLNVITGSDGNLLFRSGL